MKIYRLRETKTSQLKKLLDNGNITEEQFQIADKFFKKYNSFEGEIDWNKGLKITWDDLKKVIYKDRSSSKSQTKKKIRKGLEGFEEGKDYLVLEEGVYLEEPWVAYQPLNWEVSRTIASHYVEPSRNKHSEIEDAGWCTAYQKDDSPWLSHDDREAFLYICGETIPSKKIAVSVSKEDIDGSGSDFLYKIDNTDLNFNIWDFDDHRDTISLYQLLTIIPNFYKLMKEAYTVWEDTFRKRVLTRVKDIRGLTLNPETGRYDFRGATLHNNSGNIYLGDLTPSVLKQYHLFEKDRSGFIINFGEIFGDFDCSGLGLTSLKGAPTKVRGYFDCSNNQLTSLEGSPKEVNRGFQCSNSHLSSLEGAPDSVGYWFDCSWNNLKNLEGAPKEVNGDFDCSHNKLESLNGAPEEVDGDFYCESNPYLDYDSLESLGEVTGIVIKDF